MSDAEYNRIRQTSFTNLKQMGAYELQRFIEASSPFQRKMILQALGRR